MLLPLGAGTVIGRLLEVLGSAEIAGTFVVVRPDDRALRSAVEAAGETPLVPEIAPAEMRQSVEIALRHIQSGYRPGPDEGWLLSPADHPLLDPAVLARIIAAWRRSSEKIVIPVYAGKRGHPVIFPFRLAGEVFALGPDEGLNQLVRRHAAKVEELRVDSASVLTDLDTPQDYERLRAKDPPVG